MQMRCKTRPFFTLAVCALFGALLFFYASTSALALGNKVAPLFKDIQVDKKEIRAGEQVSVQVTIERSAAGTAEDDFIIGSATWVSKSGKIKYVDLRYDKASGKLVGKITTNRYAEPGMWRCEVVQVIDSSGIGSSQPGDDLTGADFNVIGDSPDLSPPRLLNISVSPSVVKLGEKLKVTIKASDDVSGLQSAFVTWGVMGSTAFENGIFAELAYNSQKGVLEGEIIVPDEAIPGRFTVSNISIKDNAENEFSFPGGSEPGPGDVPQSEPAQFGGSRLEDRTVDLSSAAFTVDIKSGKINVAPPVIISPTSGELDALKVSDENEDKPGMQVTIRGLAVPGYRITILSAGRVLGKATAGLDGTWRVTANISSTPEEIYAIAELPNGLKSERTSIVTRAQAAKLLVKMYAVNTQINTSSKGYFKDVLSHDPYALYIESAKDLGMFGGDLQEQSPASFDPSAPIIRGEFVKWLNRLFNNTRIYEDDEEASASAIAQRANGISQGTETRAFKGYFSDVGQSSEYAAPVEAMKDAGLVSGNPNETFKPSEQLGTSILLTGFAGEPLGTASGFSVEVSWCEGYIYDLFRKGLIPSYSDWLKQANHKIDRAEFLQLIYKIRGDAGDKALSRFKEDSSIATDGYVAGPGKILNRAEAVKLVVIAGEYKLDTSSVKFADVFGLKDTVYILTAKKYGLVSGYIDGTFCPDNQLTRAEAAKLLWYLSKKGLP